MSYCTFSSIHNKIPLSLYTYISISYPASLVAKNNTRCLYNTGLAHLV